MYTHENFKNKKAIKEAIAAGRKITCFSPGPFPAPINGVIHLEGPHYPKPHTWYATGTIKDGVLVSVK